MTSLSRLKHPNIEGFYGDKVLRTGFNYTWNALLQWKLAKNIQINLTYNGRKSGDSAPVHTGSMQVRAFF